MTPSEIKEANEAVMIALIGQISDELHNLNIEIKNIRELMEK